MSGTEALAVRGGDGSARHGDWLSHLFLFLPPCLKQCSSLVLLHPASLHHPQAPPCLRQRPRAFTRVLQRIMLHAFVLPLPCLTHNPLAAAAVVQLLNRPIFWAPCFVHRAVLRAPLSQPPVEQNTRAPCVQQSPRATTPLLQLEVDQVALSLECFLQSLFFPCLALVLHPKAVQITVAPSLVHTPLPGIAGILHARVVQKPVHPPCFPLKAPFCFAWLYSGV